MHRRRTAVWVQTVYTGQRTVNGTDPKLKEVMGLLGQRFFSSGLRLRMEFDGTSEGQVMGS
jgi:hypothetical protein